MILHRTRVLLLSASLGTLLASQLPYGAAASRAPQPSSTSPLYRVNVIEQSIVAVNYGNRATPTKIDFEGTVLLPHARGDARILSRQGTTKIEAEFENMLASARFGTQFLTYVLWAITPEGRATNLGQIIADHKDHGTLKTSTGLQTFALIVTAEPYYSVTQPSDVVVMKNVLRRDTAGTVATVHIRPELLPRGDFTWEMPGPVASHGSSQPKVSLEEYEALVELYQARNAVNVARSAGAAERSAATLDRAVRALQEAERLYQARALKQVVPVAREATQVAEDARIISTKKTDEITDLRR
jgi:hypothetical protein